MAEGKHVVLPIPKLHPRPQGYTGRRPFYTTIIEGREFFMHDRIDNIIAALYGYGVFRDIHFSVNGLEVPDDLQLDELLGLTVTIEYTLAGRAGFPEVDPTNLVRSIAIPEGFVF
eukprot:TRINITY_DN15934_c0_g1_i1.p1 TRINITY_DN15934_c0_g1~~TRINITY_DN15934_c0_g1_i1.p1  ORF type:complete len:115 (+),score=18.18 TRINITY_DN15934_c0_g1_i1:359-703(+)